MSSSRKGLNGRGMFCKTSPGIGRVISSRVMPAQGAAKGRAAVQTTFIGQAYCNLNAESMFTLHTQPWLIEV